MHYIKALPLAIMISIGGCGKLSTLDQSENFDLPRLNVSAVVNMYCTVHQ